MTKRRECRKESGVVMVEFAIVGPLVFFTVIGITLILMAVFQLIVVQYATAAGTRNGFFSAGTSAAVLPAIKGEIVRIAGKVGVRLAPTDIRVCPATTPQCTVDSVGREDGIFITTVKLKVTLLGGLIDTTVSSFATHRNSVNIP